MATRSTAFCASKLPPENRAITSEMKEKVDGSMMGEMARGVPRTTVSSWLMRPGSLLWDAPPKGQGQCRSLQASVCVSEVVTCRGEVN